MAAVLGTTRRLSTLRKASANSERFPTSAARIDIHISPSIHMSIHPAQPVMKTRMVSLAN